MITKSDLNINNKSYTHKDFYQIYPELTEIIPQLTEIWNAEDTNESDPGVVLLKIAAFVADKLNYNVDKNILEVFMTSATQESSMRKLCDMLGYNMKYYNSATTQLQFMWTGDELPIVADGISSIVLPAFSTTITNTAKDINFVLVEDVSLSKRYETVSANAIQGELVELDINDNGVLLASNIDENNRFYFPETQIAENGIWIYNSTENSLTDEWEKVDNLNTILAGKRVWKFGYSSTKNLPYIEFPSDYTLLFKDGLKVYYIRTSGNNGNIKANTLNALVNNNITYKTADSTEETVDASDKLIIKNLYSTLNGRDIETLDEAYQGFKKTIGTFDTLVTCRDYANAIYNMLIDEKTDTTPLVSNCQVSDIRDELNFSNVVVKLQDGGVTYTTESTEKFVEKPVYVQGSDGSYEEASGSYYVKEPEMTEFDLYLYPLNAIKNAYNKSTYIQSFKPLASYNSSAKGINADTYSEILENLADYKTISHVIKRLTPENNAKTLYLIKNYYQLKAKIVTKYKVNSFEQVQIKENVYQALYKNFNARELDYGEEIPYDRLLQIMENSDARIKTISLDEPEVVSNYMLADGSEGPLAYINDDSHEIGNDIYQKMIAKNILGGRIPLFNYNTNIKTTFTETNSSDDCVVGAPDGNKYYQYPWSEDKKYSVTYADTDLILSVNKINSDGETLLDNESVKIISPKLLTKVTYPMYTNYAYVYGGEESIPKNIDYVLPQSAKLYIQYTDNDETTYWIKYWYSDGKYKQTTYIDSVQAKEEDFSGIINANFEVKPTDKVTGKRTIVEGWPSDWIDDMGNTQGLLSLKTSEEIAIKYINSAAIKQQAYIYWLTNNNNTITFNRIDEINRLFEYVLDSGEYLFYTDQAKTGLITLGAGTKLLYHATETEAENEEIKWLLNAEQSITSDDVAQNGIGAFANNDWIVRNWNADNYLETQQMDIISLSKDDKIHELTLASGETEINSSKWYNLTSIEYKYSDATTSDIKQSTDSISYQIRPILNLNFGPDKVQNIKEGRNKITLYTSSYASKDNPRVNLSDEAIVEYLKLDPGKLIENIYSDDYVKEFNSDTGLKANLNIEKSGGTKISLHTNGINYSTKDNLLIYPVASMDATYTDISGTTPVPNKSLTPENGIEFNTMDNCKLPVYIPENSYALFTLYWNTASAVTEHSPVPVIEGHNVKLSLYPDGITSKDTESEIFLKNKGLSIIKIAPLPIESGDDTGRYITISSAVPNGITESGEGRVDGRLSNLNIKLVDTADNDLGLNGAIFDIEGETNLKNFFNNYIKSFKDFYATIDIDNSMLLDVKKLSSPEALFNYNNEVNKFVISELDINSFDNIEIASSSKL